MSSRLAASLASSLVLVAFVACGDPSASRTLGTNSNWFLSCDGDATCSAATTCECARCTRACESDEDCRDLPGARCAAAAESAAVSQCGGAAGTGLCLPRCGAGECPEDQACVAGGCVSSAVPANELCAPVAQAAATDRTGADELAELVATMRSAGGVTCGSSGSSGPLSGVLAVSGTLRCASRVLATDIDQNGTRSLLDSSGRTTDERLSAAGYAPNLWAESYAVGSRTASDALAVMLADPPSCTGLTRDGYTDLGTARVGRAWVVTLAAP
jgi:hypothetical protein